MTANPICRRGAAVVEVRTLRVFKTLLILSLLIEIGDARGMQNERIAQHSTAEKRDTTRWKSFPN